MPNIHADIPSSLPNEVFTDLISNDNVRIERILSHGHSSLRKVGMTKTNTSG